MSHVPGPWEYDPEGDIRDASGDIIASISWNVDDDVEHELELDHAGMIMAAAFEMLELLDECRLKLETCGYLPAVATKVCELIAKAKGGE